MSITVNTDVVYVTISDFTLDAQRRITETRQDWFITAKDLSDKELAKTSTLIIYNKRVIKSREFLFNE